MSQLPDWAREAVAALLRQTAVMLVAKRERERVEAERWLRKLHEEARARAQAERERGGPPT